MTRRHWVWLHRYVGLAVTIFLIVTALTGSLLVFMPEINEAIEARPSKIIAAQDRPMLDVFELRARSLALEPRADIPQIPLQVEPGQIFEAGVVPRIDPATGKPYELGYAALHLDPYSGELIRRAERDTVGVGPLWPITSHNLMNVVYALHKRLALPGEWGRWTLGIVAVLWTLDCFVGFYLTLPRRRGSGQVPAVNALRRRSWRARWLPAWTVAWRGSPYRVNFKQHSAAGLWTWLMLFVLAWSSVYFELGREVYQPVMSLFGMRPMLEEFYLMPQPTAKPQPALSWRQAAAVGQRLAEERAALEDFVPGRPIRLQYDEDSGKFIYILASSRSPAEGMMGTIVCFDGDTGALWKVFHLSGQEAGTTVTTWLAWLHMARIWGLPFRIFVCAMGLVVTLLSITGVYLWWKKRTARRAGAIRRDATLQRRAK